MTSSRNIAWFVIAAVVIVTLVIVFQVRAQQQSQTTSAPAEQGQATVQPGSPSATTADDRSTQAVASGYRAAQGRTGDRDQRAAGGSNVAHSRRRAIEALL